MDCAHQAPLSTGFSRQEYWSELPRPPPRGFCGESGQAVVPKQHTRSTPPASPLLGKPPPALPDKFILASHSSHGGWVSSAKAYTRQTALTVISYFPRHTRALEGGTDGHPPFLPLTPSCSIFSSAAQVTSGQRHVLALL